MNVYVYVYAHVHLSVSMPMPVTVYNKPPPALTHLRSQFSILAESSHWTDTPFLRSHASTAGAVPTLL